LAPDYVIRVSDEGTVTPTNQVDPTEQLRRHLLRQMTFKIALQVNGKRITESAVFQLEHPTLMGTMNQFFELRVVHQPRDISAEVYMVTPGMIAPHETFIARVGLPVPGQVDPADGSSSGSSRGVGSGGRGAGGGSAGAASSHTSRLGGKQPAAHSFAPVSGWYSFCTEKPFESQQSQGLLAAFSFKSPPVSTKRLQVHYDPTL
jgi:hypothetical protein